MAVTLSKVRGMANRFAAEDVRTHIESESSILVFVDQHGGELQPIVEMINQHYGFVIERMECTDKIIRLRKRDELDQQLAKIIGEAA